MSVFALSEAAFGWGGKTHEIINRKAVERLPEPARTAWAPLAAGLAAHANDADRRKSTSKDEPGRHYIDVDIYDEPPFARVPRTRKALEKKQGKDAAARWGTVPWAIEECYAALVHSLAAGDWSSAGAWASDLGHYVGDSHQPLHCTKNYDGQNTGNDGVHIRFEVTMMDRFFDESTIELEGDLPLATAGAVEFCFSWIPEAYSGVDAVLAADTTARAADPRFGDAYYEAMWRGTKEVAERQVSQAVRDLAALYHAAWIEAGSPSPPEEIPPFHAAPLPTAVAEAPARRPVALSVAAVALGAFLASLFFASL